MVQCWALSTLNEHRPHNRLKFKAENVDADKFQKNKQKNKTRLVIQHLLALEKL